MPVKPAGSTLTRRRMLLGAGGLVSAAAFPVAGSTSPLLAPGQAPRAASSTSAAADVTGRLARYMVEARTRSLPPDVLREAQHRILDTLAAPCSRDQ